MTSGTAAAAGRATAGCRAFLQACALDVQARKPGNVSQASAGHGMRSGQFLASAAAAAGPISAAGAPVGRRIEQAVAASWAAVGCNTNLGIVLGCAPIAHAALHRNSDETLRASLQRTLAGLTVIDASHAYAAIRLAHPAGIGERAEHDVAEAPVITLLEAMQLAAHRDSIASLYASGHALVFDHLLPKYVAARRRWCSEAWAATTVFMFCLALIPDTHIARKHGAETARSIREKGVQMYVRLEQCRDPVMMQDALMAWDAELKSVGINPGTSADLTVVTAFLADVLDWIEGRREEQQKKKF